MKTLFSALAITAAGFATAVSAQAAQNAATLEVTPGTTVEANVIPNHPAQPANSYFYKYSVTNGGKIVDTIPVKMCLKTSTGDWTSFDVNFSDPNGSTYGVLVPGNTKFTPADLDVDLTKCKDVFIAIDTEPLVLADAAKAEVRQTNISINPEGKNPNNINVNNTLPNIHILYEINPAANDTTCFTTDGDGNLLAACDGTAVTASGSNAGRFAINANKKNIEVATNPGQFYYNILWTNMTGDVQVVNVTFAKTGVAAKGANAIHAYAFPPSFSGVTPEAFQVVNDGIDSLAGGSDDSIEGITVPAGWTLWANYHMEWAGIGSILPAGIATTCGVANQSLSVLGTVTDANGVHTCTSGALGYKK
ncbi:hypothetical protein E4633_18885 [Geomonas terrae]|uniref:CARDB domain-containing protein n=1 Tax=Geomonas terrae TaxID=2562681 RepID=A0A4S1CAE6_9BACT|nr:hypothetical protein [Geomonas terrae]TGU70265.1 hypothetical protein E4633_18885 [Geomonas terrae]